MSRKYKNLVGKTFGWLTVVSQAPRDKYGGGRWECVCSCGKKTFARTNALTSGHKKSCGCLRLELTDALVKKDLTGKVFGRLTVQEDVGRNKFGSVLWECLCECGVKTSVAGSSLISGHTKSCGCLHHDTMHARTGEKHQNWKGGRVINDSGYVMVKAHGHPRANNCNYVREHILVIEKLLGRYLRPGETVHHWNENKSDNRSENLELFATRGEHTAYHAELRKRRRIAKQCLGAVSP